MNWFGTHDEVVYDTCPPALARNALAKKNGCIALGSARRNVDAPAEFATG